MSLSSGYMEWCSCVDNEVFIDLNLTLDQCISLERQWSYLAVAPFQKGLTHKRLTAIVESIYQLCISYGYTGFRYERLKHEYGLLKNLWLSDDTLINESKGARLASEMGDSGEYTCLDLGSLIYANIKCLDPEAKKKVSDDRRDARELLLIYKEELVNYYHYTPSE